MGEYQDIQLYNQENSELYSDKVLSFVRWNNEEKLIIVANFSAENTSKFDLKLPQDLVRKLAVQDGEYSIKDQLYKKYITTLKVTDEKATVPINIKPLQSFILKIND